MKKPVRILFLLALFNSVALMSVSHGWAFNEPTMSISTGNVTGVYYAAGSAVAKMHNRKLDEYNLRLITSATEGSIANLENVVDKTSEFGIGQANSLYKAIRGEGMWEGHPRHELRAVLGLYTESFTVIASAESGIQNLSDLTGKTVNIGEVGSTDNAQARGVFELIGLDPDQDMTIVQKPTYEASELLQSGDIDAYFYTVGHPNLSIKETSAGQRQVAIIPLDQEFIEHLAALRPFLNPTTIPIDYYPRLINDRAIPSIGVKAILFTHEDTDEAVVYQVVKEVFDNLELFKRQHPALSTLTWEDMTHGLILPVHPGAERFFQEAGSPKK